VFFLLGGVFIGRAMTRHGLDRRLALSILCTQWAGRSPHTVLAAVGLSVTLVSMWISNTAATAMMYPVTLGIIGVLAAGRASRAATGATASPSPVATPDGDQETAIPASEFARSPYATSLLLITAYASAIGGVSTPIGTATNVVAMGFFKRDEVFGRPVDFLAWSAVGVPVTIVLFIGLWAWLRVVTPIGDLEMAPLRDYLRTEYDRLGKWNRGEVNTLAVFLVVVSFWITPGFLAICFPQAHDDFTRRFPEEIVAALCPVLLFLAPVNWSRRIGTLEPSDFMKVDWGTILLFGAGLSLGGLMFKTGLAKEVGDGIFDMLGTRSVWGITAIAVAGGIVLSEFTSNAATATTLIPVTLTICQQAEIDPILPLVGVTLGASFGSALPVSTPPNAIVYSSGLIPIRRMIVAGVGIDILSGIVIWLVLRAAGAFHWTPFP
jgi:sodium-dependent dicarboxylate transporter 2/3/5